MGPVHVRACAGKKAAVCPRAAISFSDNSKPRRSP